MFGTLASASVETDVRDVLLRLASGLKTHSSDVGSCEEGEKSKRTKHQSLQTFLDVLATSAHSYSEPDSDSSGIFGL